MEEINQITYVVRSAIFEVHRELGPGLFERVYEAALARELKDLGLSVSRQYTKSLMYKGELFDEAYVIDLLVENKVIVEIKSVENLQNVHKKQLMTYLRLSGCKVGLLVNFNSGYLVDKESLIRIIV